MKSLKEQQEVKKNNKKSNPRTMRYSPNMDRQLEEVASHANTSLSEALRFCIEAGHRETFTSKEK